MQSIQPFNAMQFKLDYPQFINLSSEKLENDYNYIVLAKCKWLCYYFCDLKQRYYWSCIVLAHVLTLMYGSGGNGNNTALVGRITSATEGSVNVGLENINNTLSSFWWNQTQYGALVWSLWSDRGVSTYVGAC
jgi:hypothetical protein